MDTVTSEPTLSALVEMGLLFPQLIPVIGNMTPSPVMT